MIRYSTDGSVPTASSPIYTGPIPITKKQSVIAATFMPSGQRSDPTRVEVASGPVQTLVALKPGLRYSIYKGSFEKVPEVANLQAASEGLADKVGIVGDIKENYAIDMNGFINIPSEGVYKFSLSSDDGSVLWLGGAKLVDNDGYHGTIEQSGRIALRPGYYPVRIGFFQGGGDQSFKLSIEGPGMDKQEMPASWLLH
ncbi:MAG: PA14 domain-containing protein [Armatimonadota bacterium]